MSAPDAVPHAARVLAFVGCITRPTPYFAGARGSGIATLALDTASGHLEPLAVTGGIDNPTFLAIDAERERIYATSEVFGWHEGLVTAFRVDAATGLLHHRNTQPTLGSITAFCGLDPSRRHLLVANYGHEHAGEQPRRQAVLFPLFDDGDLAPPAASVAFDGSGPIAARQSVSHAHCIVASPEGRFVLVADLGGDQVLTFALDQAASSFGDGTPVARTPLPPGSGPRHLVFHPCGRVVFLVHELASAVSALAFDPSSGRLEPCGTLSTRPAGASGDNAAADLQLTPDGRLLLASNRGDDSIAIFAVDPSGERFDAVGHVWSGGRTPRSLGLDPSGRCLLVCNQDSDRVVAFRVDGARGTLDETARVALGTPACVRLASFGR